MIPKSCQQLLLIVLAGLFVSGCGATRQFRSESTGQFSSSAEIPLEQRAEAQAHYSLGLMHEMDREPEAAFEEYYLSVQSDPSHTDLVLTVAQNLLTSERPDEARVLLEKSLTYSPTNALVHTFLGNAYAMTGNKRKAVQANRRAIELQPDSLAAYDNLVHLKLADGDAPGALKILSEAASIPDPSSWFLLNLSDMMVAYGRAAGINDDELRAQVAPILDQAMVNRPSDSRELLRLGDGFAGIGEVEKALTIYEQIRAESVVVPQNLREKIATLYIQSQRFENAREILDELIRSQPTNLFARLLLANVEEAEGNFEAAAEQLERILRFPSVSESPYIDLINLYLALDQPEKAQDTIERMREDFEPSFLIEYFTALTFNYMEDFEEGLQHLLAAQAFAEQQSPDRLTATFYFQLGAAHERVKNYSDSEAAFLKAIELEPEFGAAMNYLGYTWADLGTNLDEAYKLIRKAVDLEPENPAYLDSLAWVLFKQGKFARALPEMLKAIENSEVPDPTLYDHLGDIYNALGERAQAENAWRQALEIEPNPEIESKLQPGVEE